MTKLKPNQFLLANFLITERPILFQTEMVQAILENRKNQTRRTKGLTIINHDPDGWNRKNNLKKGITRLWDLNKEYNPNPWSEEFGFMDPLGSKEYIKCPYGKKGDLLWVRETWQTWALGWIFKSTYGDVLTPGIRWKPSIHMPKEACQIWLMIEEIYPERLQDISWKDAISEGIQELWIYGFAFYKDYLGKNDGYQHPIFSFNSLWISINGRESLEVNPWVWVIKFRVLSKTGRPSDQAILDSRLSLLPTEGRSPSQKGKEELNV
jgi:hypothetical protein